MDRIGLRVLWLLLTVFWVLLALYAVWSFSLTDPNLVFTSWEPYWNAQQWLWNQVYANAQFQTWLYAALAVGLFSVYFGILYVLHKNLPATQMLPKHWIVLAIVVSPLLFSYNALSHDVFNYLFNAKMVVVYGADPHQTTALAYSTDEWVRFMHNTHTVAPYGYAWTALSLLPYLAGLGKFSLTWLLFKLTAAGSFVLLAFGLHWFATVVRKQPLVWSEVAVLFLNPLLIIEVLGNAHNDLWMAVPAILAIGVAINWGTKKLVVLFGLLSFSVLIKFATLILLPVFICILYAENVWQRMRGKLLLKLPLALVVPVLEKLFGTYVRGNVVGIIATTCSVLLLVPLLTSRSQLFHPWYLVWALVWLPFISSRFIKILLISMSASSLLRYIPWLLAGGFSSDTVFVQQLVTWVGGLVILLVWIAIHTVSLRRQPGFLQKL